ncbi:MAG: dephospho-CoA kinase [Clostridia bacterium]|nr:dephospho-CoA kinase [Clostridia bacterium]
MHARNKPFILGLTGGIGCGKTTCAGILADLGCEVIDADQISRELTQDGSPVLEPIREAFGDDVFLEPGKLDRAKLGQIVFADVARKRQLEGILHPAIQKEMLNRVENAQTDVVVLDIPLLFETGMDVLCDEVWVLSVDRETQIQRVMQRDSLTREEIEQRIDSQMPVGDKEERADRVIRTSKTVEDLRSEVTRLYQALRRKHL